MLYSDKVMADKINGHYKSIKNGPINGQINILMVCFDGHELFFFLCVLMMPIICWIIGIKVMPF